MVKEKIINPEKITHIKNTLKKLPKKNPHQNLRDLVEFFSREIHETMEKGYSLEEIHKVFVDNGIVIKFTTFKSYLKKKTNEKTQERLKTSHNEKPKNIHTNDTDFISKDTPDHEL